MTLMAQRKQSIDYELLFPSEHTWAPLGLVQALKDLPQDRSTAPGNLGKVLPVLLRGGTLLTRPGKPAWYSSVVPLLAELLYWLDDVAVWPTSVLKAALSNDIQSPLFGQTATEAVNQLDLVVLGVEADDAEEGLSAKKTARSVAMARAATLPTILITPNGASDARGILRMALDPPATFVLEGGKIVPFEDTQDSEDAIDNLDSLGGGGDVWAQS